MFNSVKIIGERNSGTNFVAKAINLNCTIHVHQSLLKRTRAHDARLLRHLPDEAAFLAESEPDYDALHVKSLPITGGWKHALLTPERVAEFSQTRHVLFLCVTRHPATWLKSTLKRPFHSGKPMPDEMSEFLRTPWITQIRDGLDGATLPNPVALWKVKTDAYYTCKAQAQNVQIVRYEDFVRDFEGTIRSFGFGLRRDGDIQIPKRHARSFIKDDSRFEDYQARLALDPWQEFSAEDAAFIRAELGTELMQKLGYE